MPIKARITPREEWPVLPAMVPLPVEISDTPKAETSNKYGSEQVKVLLEVFEGPYSSMTVTDPITNLPKQVRGKAMIFLGLTVGNTNSGQKSMLRQFLEGLFGPLSDEQAAGIDLEGLKGQRLVMVGNYANPDAEQLRLKPLGFSRYVAGQVSEPIAPAAVAPVDGYQYNETGTHRWKAGMAAWEPVPAAVAPPPPPPAAVAPPPPPPAAPPKVNF